MCSGFPIREWNVNYGVLDDEVIDHVADGRLGKKAAYHEARLLIGRSARFMWQCGVCCGVEKEECHAVLSGGDSDLGSSPRSHREADGAEPRTAKRG